MTLSFTLKNLYPGCTIKKLLEEYLLIPQKIHRFLRAKRHLHINGEMINWRGLVRTGDTIHLVFDDDDCPQREIPSRQAELVNCLYQDGHLITVDKPEGVKTHSNESNEIALLNHVSAYVGQACYVIHRLDMETSGAVMFAKNPFVLPIINRLLGNKDTVREYWALVQGKLEPEHQVFQDKIGHDHHDRRKRMVNRRNGQTALAIVNRLRVFPNGTLVKCRLKTGHTHQIRVYLSTHDHAIIGGPLYSKIPARRLMLHTHKLSFAHPFTLEKISVRAKSQTFETDLS